MNRPSSLSKSGVLGKTNEAALRSPHNSPRHRGHAHFWQRALSRRNYFGAAAGVVGAAGLAYGKRPFNGADPRPIPGGLQFLGPGTELFHVFLVGPNTENATITDLNGFVGGAEIQGPWTVSGPSAPTPMAPATYDADMSFMTGEYIGVVGSHRQGSFAFI